jgi:4-hydroxy-4-methyl-2-oxoglutarate aldolase
MTVSDAVIARAATSSSATLHEAAKRIGALPAGIRPLAPDVRVCGRAFPVKSPPGDNLWLHHAIYRAAPGDVLIVDPGPGLEFGYWGEVMAVAAQTRGIAGLVINGGVRDGLRLLELGFAVFTAGPAIRGTGKYIDGNGSLGAPVTLGDVTIHHGDLVLGDFDGVVVLPHDRAAAIVDAGAQRDADEQDIFRRLRAGETTMDVYRLPTPTKLPPPATLKERT